MPPRLLPCIVLALGSTGLLAQDADAAPDREVVKLRLQQFHANWPKASQQERFEAIATLAQLGGPEAAQALADKLADRSALVRKELADALGRLKQPNTVPSLAAALQREHGDPDGSLETYKAICKALGAIGDPKAIEPLTRGLLAGNREAPEWHDRVVARLDGLGSLKHVEAIDKLVSLLAQTGGTGRGGRARAVRSDAPTRLQQAVMRNLRRLTGADHADEQAWRSWWKENKATFKFR